MKPQVITPDITIRLLPQQQIPASAVNCYGLAGKVVISDTAWPELEPFRIGLSGEWEGDDLPVLQEFGPPYGEADRSVEGWVAEKDRLVSCRDVENGCRVAITEIGEFFISTTCDQITVVSIDVSASAAEIMMALLGPPMILAFAAQDMWLMHAGAVERGYLSGLPVLENQPWRGNFHDAVLKDQKKPLEKQAVINGIGGDGGNRTRVRKHSALDSTCLALSIIFRLAVTQQAG